MNTFSNYTPLESLLLFQSLRADGVDNINFGTISEQLKSVPLVRNAPGYSDDRLGPDALRELYLRLVKEEVRYDRERQPETEHIGTQLGNVSSPTRKRKISSPTYIPSVQEAAQHSHLIPQLVTRLYARYRESTVAQIREYEHRYDLLSPGNESRKPNDSSLSQSASTTATTNGRATEPLTRTPTTTAESATDSPKDPPLLPSRSKPLPQHRPQLQTTVSAQTSNDSRPSPTTHVSSGFVTPSSKPGTPVDSHAPGLHQHPPQPSLVSGLAPNQRVIPVGSGPRSLGSESQSPASTLTPVPQGQAAFARASPSPRPTQPPSGPSSLPQSPHPVMPAAQAHPSHHPPVHPQHFQQHVRSPLIPASANERMIVPSYGTPTGPHVYPQYGQPSDPRATYAPQGRHVPLVAQPYPTQPPHSGGYQLQPFYLDSSGQQHQNQHRGPAQQAGRPLQTPQHAPRPVQTSAMQASHGPATGPRPLPRPQLIHDIVAALATPPRSQKRPLWKSARSAPPQGTPEAPPRPLIEPLSPTLGRAKSPLRLSKAHRPRQSHPFLDAPNQHSGRQSIRDRSPNSVASSATHDTTRTRARSHSTISNSGITSAHGDRTDGRRAIKAESPAPSGDADASEETQVASRGRGRKRRGTLGSHAQAGPNKRKRQQSVSTTADDASEGASSPPPQSHTVHASRNFTKLSATLMNDINSHKHASYFAGPVRDRDAEGYSNIVKQPQHLKSIRAAITAGTRAVAAAVQAMESPSGTPLASVSLKAGDGTTSVELERSADLMPPKAIVNGAQLEKEVMRMFANAVMFNPGEDGLVADAREMFEDVDAKIRVWRGAERDTGGDDDDDSKGKRRKP